VRALPLSPPKGGSKTEFVTRTWLRDVRAPYSAGWNLQQCFYAISYSSHPLTSWQNFTELNASGVAEYTDVAHVDGYISETVQEMASDTIND